MTTQADPTTTTTTPSVDATPAPLDTAARSADPTTGSVEVTSTTPQPTPEKRSSRLGGVDGLRAFAALWVVLFHIRAFSGGRLPLGLDTFVRSGSTGVSLFLVLSGFCLFLPFSGGRTHRFRAKDFFRRRWLRLVPAYYASIALVVLAIVVTAGRAGLPRLSGSSLAEQGGAHLGLVQQFFPSTFYGLNGAYWSLGLEWEFYLTLPLLIWAARRWGVGRTVAAVVVVNVLYRFALVGIISGGLTSPHGAMANDVLPNIFLGRWGEFAFGMLAAELYTTGAVSRVLPKLRWAILALVPLGLAIAGDPIAHLVFGLVFFILLCMVLENNNVIARMFSWKPAVIIGTISYSIYLIHTPLLEILDKWLTDLGGSPNAVLYGLIALLPVVIFAAWLLFVTVERRSLSQATLEASPGAALLSPKFLRRRITFRPWTRPTVASASRVEALSVNVANPSE